MRIKNTISHNRKGVSTILGTLIFIGILFSAYIPMTLVMKQADNIYERTIHEVRAQDELQYDESLVVYGFSETDPDWITVVVRNNGEEVVEIVGIWLNDERTEVCENIASSKSVSFDPIELPGSEGDSLSVKVTTSNGNVFACTLGTVRYSTENGWYTPSLAICVTIINDSGQYEILITEVSVPTNIYGEYTSQGTEHDDISKTFLVPNLVPLPVDAYDFDVIVKKKVGGGWDSLDVVSPVVIPTIGGNPVVYIVADGT